MNKVKSAGVRIVVFIERLNYKRHITVRELRREKTPPPLNTRV